jgi:hypothetical protein
MRLIDALRLIGSQFTATVRSGTLTADRTLLLPDRDGTLATVDQITASGTTIYPYSEKITISTPVTGTAVIATLTRTPRSATDVRVIVNGQSLQSFDTNPAFTVSGSTITWNTANAYPLDSLDKVAVVYFSLSA